MGGPTSADLRRRLRARSVKCARSGGAVLTAGNRARFVASVAGGAYVSRGLWGSVREALRSCLPVVAFPVGCSVSCFPALGERWAVAGSNAYADGFRWAGRQPAQSLDQVRMNEWFTRPHPCNLTIRYGLTEVSSIKHPFHSTQINPSGRNSEMILVV